MAKSTGTISEGQYEKGRTLIFTYIVLHCWFNPNLPYIVWRFKLILWYGFRASLLKRWKYGPLLPLNMAQKSSKNELNIGKRRIFRPAFSSWCVNMGSNCRYKGLLQLTITLKYFMYVQTTNHGLLSDLLFNYIT